MGGDSPGMLFCYIESVTVASMRCIHCSQCQNYSILPGYLSQLVPVMSRWMEKTSDRSPIAGYSTEELRETMVRRRMMFASVDTHDT